MSNTNVDEFSFIGITEKFNESIQLFNKTFDMDFDSSTKLNVNNDKKKYTISDEEYGIIKELNQKDFSFYNESIKKFYP